MKKKLEIYITDEDAQLIEMLKNDTGYRKPGMAIITAIHSYFRYQQQIRRLIDQKQKLENKLKYYEQ